MTLNTSAGVFVYVAIEAISSLVVLVTAQRQRRTPLVTSHPCLVMVPLRAACVLSLLLVLLPKRF